MQTWGFGFSFQRGDHKAVIRLDPARLAAKGEPALMKNKSIIPMHYNLCPPCAAKRRQFAPADKSFACGEKVPALLH
jgi:hypothetical protein